MKKTRQIKQRVNIPVLMATKTMKDYLASIPTEEADQLKEDSGMYRIGLLTDKDLDEAMEIAQNEF